MTRTRHLQTSVDLLGVLNEMYSRFDRLVEEAGLWKVETVRNLQRDGAVHTHAHVPPSWQVGDAYIVVGGLVNFSEPAAELAPSSSSSARAHLDRVFHLAVRMLDELAAMRVQLGLPLHMRVGVHCGDVVTGVIGSQRPRFCERLLSPTDNEDLFTYLVSPRLAGVLGHAMTVAEHVEGSGALDRVTCTEEAHKRYLASSFEFLEATPITKGTQDRSRPLLRGRFQVSLTDRTEEVRTPGPMADAPQ